MPVKHQLLQLKERQAKAAGLPGVPDTAQVRAADVAAAMLEPSEPAVAVAEAAVVEPSELALAVAEVAMLESSEPAEPVVVMFTPSGKPEYWVKARKTKWSATYYCAVSRIKKKQLMQVSSKIDKAKELAQLLCNKANRGASREELLQTKSTWTCSDSSS